MKLAKFLTISLFTLSLTLLSQADEPPASYATCTACHQANGEGLGAVFPPLAGSEWVNGPVENLIRIQLRGLHKEITVKGKEYNSIMPANATMSDTEIAEVLTYIRSSWGNKASAVTPDMVKALRGEVGKPMLTVADLIDPNKPAEKKAPLVVGEEKLKSGKFTSYTKAESKNSFPDSLDWYIYLFIAICLVPVTVSFVNRKS